MQSVSWSRVSGDHYHGSCVEDEGCVVGIIRCRRVRVYSVRGVVESWFCRKEAFFFANMLVFVSSFEIVLRHSYPSVHSKKRENDKEGIYKRNENSVSRIRHHRSLLVAAVMPCFAVV